MLISFCIPTFNRASHIQKTLTSIFELPIMRESNEVEVVVSDNASTDNTQQVVMGFANRYPGKVRYFRNEENVKDANFEKALKRGDGEYLHLLNDTTSPTDIGIREMLKVVRRHISDQVPIYFKSAEGDYSEHLHKSQDSFIDDISFYTTWICEFGIWRKELESISDFSRDWKLMLVQVDVWFRMIAHHKSIVVVRGDFLKSGIGQRYRNIKYLIPEVFGRNYLSILRRYVSSDGLSVAAYEREKKRVLLGQIVPFYIYVSKYVIMPRRGFVRYLWKDYWRNAYYYWAVILCFTSSMAYYCLKPFWPKYDNYA